MFLKPEFILYDFDIKIAIEKKNTDSKVLHPISDVLSRLIDPTQGSSEENIRPPKASENFQSKITTYTRVSAEDKKTYVRRWVGGEIGFTNSLNKHKAYCYRKEKNNRHI